MHQGWLFPTCSPLLQASLYSTSFSEKTFHLTIMTMNLKNLLKRYATADFSTGHGWYSLFCSSVILCASRLRFLCHLLPGLLLCPLTSWPANATRFRCGQSS